MKLIEGQFLNKGINNFQEEKGDTFIYLDIEHNNHSNAEMKAVEVAGFIVRDGRIVRIFDLITPEFSGSGKYVDHSDVIRVNKQTGILHELRCMFRNTLTDNGRNIWVGQSVMGDIAVLDRISPGTDFSGGRENNIVLDLVKYWNGSLVENIQRMRLDKLTPILLHSMTGVGLEFSAHHALYDSVLSYIALQKIISPDRTNASILNKRLLGGDIVINICEIKNRLIDRILKEDVEYHTGLLNTVGDNYSRLLKDPAFINKCVHIENSRSKNDIIKTLEDHLLGRTSVTEFKSLINLVNTNKFYATSGLITNYTLTNPNCKMDSKDIEIQNTDIYKTVSLLLNGKLPLSDNIDSYIRVNKLIDIRRPVVSNTSVVNAVEDMKKLPDNLPNFTNLTCVNEDSTMIPLKKFLLDLVSSREKDTPSSRILTNALKGYVEEQFNRMKYLRKLSVYKDIYQYEEQIFKSFMEVLKDKYLFSDFVKMLRSNQMACKVRLKGIDSSDTISLNSFMFQDTVTGEFYMVEGCVSLNQILYMIDVTTDNRELELNINKYTKCLSQQKLHNSKKYKIYFV